MEYAANEVICNCKHVTMADIENALFRHQGSTAQFGKRIRPKILPHTKGIKGREYCMYFPLLSLHGWGERLGEGRRHNCAVMPLQKSFKILFD